MANNWATNIVNWRRSQGKATPWADYKDWRASQGLATSPWGYKPTTTGDSGPVVSEQENCVSAGGKWVINPTTGVGYCDTSSKAEEDKVPTTAQEVITGNTGKPAETLNVGKYENWTPQDQTPIPWSKMGVYGDYFQQMLQNPAFGNQTLEELEQARINALQGDLANQYGYQADELQRRLNAEAEAAGMFSSGARVGSIGKGLSELGRQQQVEFAKGSADIRGQRPELLLQQRQQNADIANMWGTMDQASQATNLDAMLNNKLMEYDRQYKNGTLSLDAFQGNTNMLALFLDYQINSAQTNSDIEQNRALIDKIYNGMSNEDRATFLEFISNLANIIPNFSFGK